MVSVGTIATLDFVLGALAALGLVYLFYAETLVVHYRRFFRLITLGLLVYAVTGPVVGTIAPAYIHAIHATAALCITLGLYDLVREDLRHDENFAAILSPDLELEHPADEHPDPAEEMDADAD